MHTVVTDLCAFNAEIRYSTQAQLEDGKKVFEEILYLMI